MCWARQLGRETRLHVSMFVKLYYPESDHPWASYLSFLVGLLTKCIFAAYARIILKAACNYRGGLKFVVSRMSILFVNERGECLRDKHARHTF